jgi:hypothetical protein
VAGVPYAAAVSASGGALPYEYEVVDGALPAGLTLNPATGAITGIPSGGSQSFTLAARDANGCRTSLCYRIFVAAAAAGNIPTLRDWLLAALAALLALAAIGRLR